MVSASVAGLSRPSPVGFTERRRALRLSLCAGFAAAAPTVVAGAAVPAAAEPASTAERPSAMASLAQAMPIVDARFPAEMAPGVFVVPDKRIFLVPNVGIVVGQDAVLVIDCGLGIESAENVLTLARRLAPGRRIVLTVTHAHPEHGFGAQVFKPDARIVYNRGQRDYFARAGATLLDGFRAGSTLPPEQKRVLDGIVLTPPDDTYDGGRATLDLGGRSVELRAFGTAHSPGDQIVHLPEERIIFSGDLIEERMFPIVPLFPPMITAADMDLARWEAALTEIVRLQPRLIVPGHGNLGGMEVAQDVLDYFGQVRALVQAAGPQAAGPSRDGLERRIRERHPTWEHSQYIAPTLRYLTDRL